MDIRRELFRAGITEQFVIAETGITRRTFRRWVASENPPQWFRLLLKLWSGDLSRLSPGRGDHWQGWRIAPGGDLIPPATKERFSSQYLSGLWVHFEQLRAERVHVREERDLLIEYVKALHGKHARDLQASINAVDSASPRRAKMPHLRGHHSR